MKKHTIYTLAVVSMSISITFFLSVSGQAEQRTPKDIRLPLQAEGWEGITLTRLCLEVNQSYPQIEDEFSQPIAEAVERVLRRTGVQVVDEAEPFDATLTFTVTLNARGRVYSGVGLLYTGADAEGMLELFGKGRPTVSVAVSQHHPPPFLVTYRPAARPDGLQDAPFGRVWPSAILEGLYKLWGMQVFVAALRDQQMRDAATRALVEAGEPSVDPLIAALKDERWQVRRAATGALGEIGDTRAVEPLIAALKYEDSRGRGWAAGALGEVGDMRAVEPLIAALKDEDSGVRRAAARALGEIADARAVELLIAALKDDHRFLVREAAAGALGEIGDARAVEPLIAALKDEHHGVRQGAAGALGKITGRDFGQDQTRWQRWWQENKEEILKDR